MKTETARTSVRMHMICALVALLVLISTPTTGRAEIKIVQMKISGYLCGN